MSNEVLTIHTDYKCPKPECARLDGSAIVVTITSIGGEESQVPVCKKCGGQMVEIRMRMDSFQREF